jgi:hypothetical protein
MEPLPEKDWHRGEWKKGTVGDLLEKLKDIPPETRVLITGEGDLTGFLWRGPRCFVVLSNFDNLGVKE